MPKQRKTRKEKEKTHQRLTQASFKIKEEWLEQSPKRPEKSAKISISGTKYLRQDLTKTIVLTMLVLALELALWLYLSRR